MAVYIYIYIYLSYSESVDTIQMTIYLEVNTCSCADLGKVLSTEDGVRVDK